MLNAHARRGTSLLSCPSCGVPVESHQYHEHRSPSGEAVGYNTAVEAPPADTLERFLPFQHLLSESKRVPEGDEDEEVGRREYSVLYTAKFVKERGGGISDIKTATIILARRADENFSEEMCSRLCAFFAALYPRITKPCIPSSEGVKAFSPYELSEHYKTSFSALAACLFGLGTGKSQRDVVKISAQSDHQSQYLANKYRWYDFIYNFCILYYIISYTNYITQAETPKLAICASSSIELALAVRTALF